MTTTLSLVVSLCTALAQKKLSAAAAEIKPIVDMLRMMNSPSQKSLGTTLLPPGESPIEIYRAPRFVDIGHRRKLM